MNKSYDDLDLLESTPNKGKVKKYRKTQLVFHFILKKKIKSYFGNPRIARQRRRALNQPTSTNQSFAIKNSNLELKKLNKENSELMQMVKELKVNHLLYFNNHLFLLSLKIFLKQL